VGGNPVLAPDHGATPGAVHGYRVEQAHQGQQPVYLATLVARDPQSPVLGLQTLERLEQNMHPARVHELDVAQVDHDRAAFVLENRHEGVVQHRGSDHVDFPLDAEDDRVFARFARALEAGGWRFLKRLRC
jgi:hypothetical protein